jgi:hypothetical protein
LIDTTEINITRATVVSTDDSGNPEYELEFFTFGHCESCDAIKVIDRQFRVCAECAPDYLQRLDAAITAVTGLYDDDEVTPEQWAEIKARLKQS